MKHEMSPLRLCGNDLVPLFPTYLWRSKTDTATSGPMNKNILDLLEKWTGGFENSTGDKVQTTQKLDLQPELAPLIEFVDGAVNSVLDFLKAEHRGFKITGCWANVSPPGVSHGRHSHPNNFLSGVYYVASPEGGDFITFYDPRPQPPIMSPPPREIAPVNAGKASMKVETGDLILFPSWLFHSVPPNRSDQYRVSIAFNFMFLEFEEAMSPPRWEGQESLEE